MSWIKKLVFLLIALFPLFFIVFWFGKIIFSENYLQSIYMNHIRNIYFDCIDFTNDNTVYRMKSGKCILNNLEYSTTITSNENGHRYLNFSASPANIAVIGDSHAHGFGVNDTSTFSSLLSAKTQLNVTNFSIASYDTVRELEALKKFKTEEEVVVIQYCDNDFWGNEFFIQNGLEKYLLYVEGGWKGASSSYFERKERGYAGILRGIAQTTLDKISVFNEQGAASKGRDISLEMKILSQILKKYEETLRDKKVIIFESSEWGNNSPLFKSELEKWLNYYELSIDISVLDSTAFLSKSDYYFLDDHLNSNGHITIANKLADLMIEIGSLK